MSEIDTSTVAPAWCKKLRWKGYALDVENPMQVALILSGTPVLFRCLSTCEPFGPDDRPAAPEQCNEQRRCYERHPKLRVLDDSANS